MRRIDVFFYGLFMDEDLLRAKGVTATHLRPASVPGFQLRIGKRATLVPAQSGRVFGLIASLSHVELERLYSEPSVQAYRPEAVLAHLSNGETLAALCFNLVERLHSMNGTLITPPSFPLCQDRTGHSTPII